jgi:uncharacterized protein (DUF58 family)
MTSTDVTSLIPDARQFEILARRAADSLNYGNDRSPSFGPGVEYVQSRQYQPGDPIRSIDWRATARTGKPWVREYETLRQIPCYLLIDTSASMCVASHATSKLETAVRIAAGLAFACLDQVRPVGVLGIGETELQVRPTLRRDTIMQWLLTLQKVGVSESTQSGQRIRHLYNSLESTSLVILLSDLHDPFMIPAMTFVAARHDCIAIQIRDPAERGVSGVGFVRGMEAETGRRVTSLSVSSAETVSIDTDQLRRARIDHTVIDTDKPWLASLRQFLKHRGGNTRSAR